MSTWTRILCAVDGSESSLSAAEQARSLADGLGTELIHLFVIPTNLAVLPGPPLQPEIRQALNESAEELLEDLARGASGGKWPLGGNATKTIHCSPVPVLITRAREGPFTGFARILACVDGSHESEFAARQAIAFGKVFDGQVSLCHVAHVDPEKLARLSADERFIEAKEAAWIEMSLSSLLANAESHGCRAEAVYLSGRADEQILGYAKEWDADLITTGSRGLGGFASLTLGSISNHIARYATSSVLVAHRPRH